MKLVASSDSKLVDRHDAIRILTERAVLTRAVCRELLDAKRHFVGWRTLSSHGFLMAWIEKNFPVSHTFDRYAKDGLDSMVVPRDCGALMQEIREGAKVCDALFRLTTADSSDEEESDRQILSENLERYWATHGTPVIPPPLHGARR